MAEMKPHLALTVSDVDRSGPSTELPRAAAGCCA